MKKTFALSATAFALVAAGCGGDDDSSEATEEAAATPQEAIAEIGEVRTGLDQAVAAYRKGEAAEAEELAATSYLEHFELVEGPLEEQNEELNEDLEVLISTTIRDAIKQGEPAKEVTGLVDEANEGLDQAEKELKG